MSQFFKGNILIITKRTPWFMETFDKIKGTLTKVYEICHEPVDQTPFPFHNYQKIMGTGPYPGYRKAMKIMPKYALAPTWSNIFIVNTEKVRFEGPLPDDYIRLSYILITFKKLVKDFPEMREYLLKHRYWLRYLRRAVWEKDAISLDFLCLNGNGYRGVMRVFQKEKPDENQSEFVKDIYMTDAFYNSPKGSIVNKKILTDELQISTKL
jgi:hypothetical protein